MMSNGRAGRLFRWFLRADKKLDPVLERRLKKNRESLEEQRREMARQNQRDNIEGGTGSADASSTGVGSKTI